MRRELSAFGALWFSLVFTAASHAQIVNGSFEQPVSPCGFAHLPFTSTSVTGWTALPWGCEWYSPQMWGYGPAPEGNNVIDLTTGIQREGGIEQAFSAIVGRPYIVSFWLGTNIESGPDSSATVVVSAGDFQQSYRVTGQARQITWRQFSFTFVPRQAITAVRFQCFQDASYYNAYLDDVVVSSAVPARTTTWGRVKSRYR